MYAVSPAQPFPNPDPFQSPALSNTSSTYLSHSWPGQQVCFLFIFKINILFYVYVCEVDFYMGVSVLMEARGLGFPRAGVLSECSHLTCVQGTQLRSSP